MISLDSKGRSAAMYEPLTTVNVVINGRTNNQVLERQTSYILFYNLLTVTRSLYLMNVTCYNKLLLLVTVT